LYRRIARIPGDAPDEFSEAQLRLYIDLVIRENPTLSGPRYSFADTAMANLLSLHLGKNVQVWVEEQLEDGVLQATANSVGVEVYTLEDLRRALIEKYGEEEGLEKYLETGFDNYTLVTCLRQSHQVFPTTVSVIQRGNHFERLLRSSEEKSLYESERPELMIKYKRHKAIWHALRNVVRAPVVTSGPVPVYLRTVSPLKVWQTILDY